MENKTFFKKETMFSIVTAIVTFVLLLSSTFAWFTNRYESDLYPEIVGADFVLNVTFGGGGSTVNLSTGLPSSDAIGYGRPGYDLTIENIGNITINTNIKVELYPNNSPYTSNPNLTLFQQGQLRNALVLKSYKYVNPANPSQTSTTPNTQRWVKTQNCVIGSQTYDCIVGEYNEDIYSYHIIPGEKYVFEIKFWINENVRFVDNTKVFFGRVVVETTQEEAVIISSNSANYPILVEGMIPVIWDEDLQEWIIVNEWDPRWYNYDTTPKLDEDDNIIAVDRQWANVINVSGNNSGKYMYCEERVGCLLYPEVIGEPIPEAEIKSMFVWIPRFRYAVKQGTKNGTENQIDAFWEQGVSERYVATGLYNGNVPTNFYTSSAFKELNREMFGFWMGKFEVGMNSNNEFVSYAGAEMNESISSSAWNDIINSRYQIEGRANYGMIYQSNDRSSQIKNSQWDAVAFLSQSRYGKFGKDGLPVMPNNNFAAGIETTNLAFQVRANAFGGAPAEQYIQSTVRLYNPYLNIKSGYVCNLSDYNACLNYTHSTQNEVGNMLQTNTNDIWGRTVRTRTRHNFSNESFSTTSVYYTNPVYGVRGSTTGNIYGIYDMAMGRDELTMTQYVQTGRYHSSIPALKTIAIPDSELGAVYIAEDGKVYNGAGVVIHQNILQSSILLTRDFIIRDTVAFNMTSFAYFNTNYYSFVEGGNTYFVERGSSMYLLDAITTKRTLYGARVDVAGDNLSFISRGGGLSGQVSIIYQMTVTGDPGFDLSILRSSSMAPHITNTGIFAQLSSRLPNFAYSATTTFLNIGDYEITLDTSVVDSLQITPSSRVVVVV